MFVLHLWSQGGVFAYIWQMWGNSHRNALAVILLGILVQIFQHIKHVLKQLLTHLPLNALCCLKWLIAFSFDKVREKGEVLKAVRKLSLSLGPTNIQGNVLRNGMGESTVMFVVQTCVNIVSVGTLWVKTCRSSKRFANEYKTPPKLFSFYNTK